MSDNIIQVNDEIIHTELKDLVKNTVEETLNAMLDAEADRLVNADRYARDEERNLDRLWCGYFEGNEKSKRCQEKCGFKYHHTNKDVYWKLMDDIKTEHITSLKKDGL